MDDQAQMQKCKTCGGAATGFKCDVCGEESNEHDETHACGGEHCMPKCEGCNEAEGKCNCAPTDTKTE